MARIITAIHGNKIPALTKISSTQVQLAAGITPSALNCSTGTIGFGGVDLALVASSFYYVYLVHNGVTYGLVASLSASAPTGFSVYRKVGAFYTDSLSSIFKSYSFGEINPPVLSAKINSLVPDGEQSDWINGNISYSAPNFTCTYSTNIFSRTPTVVVQSFRSNGDSRTSIIKSESASSVTYSIKLLDNSNGTDDHFIQVTKQGVDAIQPDWRL